jgi:hypothetical protein
MLTIRMDSVILDSRAGTGGPQDRKRGDINDEQRADQSNGTEKPIRHDRST